MNKNIENNATNSTGRSAEDRALDTFAEMMIDKLKTIQQDWQKPWFMEGSMVWPRNLAGREYNGMNALMLQFLCEKQGYTMPVFCTFDRIAAMNYLKQKNGVHKPARDENGEKLPMVSINKGEKSFPVFVTTHTVVNKETKERIKYEDYKQLSDDQKELYQVFPKLQVFNVFNVAQTNLKESRPELFAELEAQCEIKKDAVVGEGKDFVFPALDAMVEGNGWICPIKPTYGNDAYYSISNKEIVIPEKRQFVSGEAYYGTMSHEMMHSTGAEDVLNRIKKGSRFGSDDYATEELVAELGAALIMSRYGVSRGIKEDSVPYLKSWLGRLKEKPEFIKTVLLDVKRGSAMITKRIDIINERMEQGLEPLPPRMEQQEAKDNLASEPQTKLSDEDIAERLDGFMNDFYFDARRDNGVRIAGYTFIDERPALRLTVDSSVGTSQFVVTHQLDEEDKDRFFMCLMDDGKEVGKAREMPHNEMFASSFLRDAAQELTDYENKKNDEQQEEQKSSCRRGR